MEIRYDVHGSCSRLSGHYVGRSQDCTVGITTGYRLVYRGVGVQVLVGTKFFSSAFRPYRFRGPSIFLSVVKRPGLEADLSPHNSVDVRNTWNYIYIQPTTRLHGVVLN
jgi:hypothetical protein